ncbi:MAG: preprotein translocase subunit SecA [Candidatus Hydrogenedentota bacterium]|nr:MAG: preprotein translocase subunit SecA [Candidatus Hydrogenedentota bacterium]
MLQTVLKKVFGTKHERDIKRLTPIVEQVSALEPEMRGKTDEELAALTPHFRERLDNGESLELLLPEAFAAVREAARRTIGLRPFDVQVMGGIVLHEGRIAEMKTGEGKTLVATMPVYLNALTGRGVHVVTVNDYLARRDAEWMGPVFRFLGLEVGFIQNEMENEARRRAYACDITYGTNNEFGFDYLRDNMVPDASLKVQRGHYYAIVDEVDSILIDEARTPLIISGPAEESTQIYYQADRIAAALRRDQDYEIDEKDRAVTLTETGVTVIENRLGCGNLYNPENMHLVHHIVQALRARELYKRDTDYVVKDGEVIIVDEFTGRMMPGRRWSDGLHQAVEAKERLPIKRESQTLATITFQNYFKMYEKLAGMTGTADTEATEFMQIYNLDVVVLPTNKPMIRVDHPDVIYKTEREKFQAVIEEIEDCYERGQPVLVGTISIEKSERLSELLTERGIPHHVLNAKHHEREADIVAQAGRLKAVTIATNMAGRGTDIMLGGNPAFLARTRAQPDDPESYERELSRAKEECAREHEQVVAVGGLHILGTERHESRRIDNQLRGRSGRQGDPGSSRFYLSLEDDLMRLFGSERVAKMMDVMKWEEGEPISHKLVTKAVARAQERVEMMNFERRKRLLDYDNVMNQQREIIYDLRATALEAEDIDDYILEAAEEFLDAAIEENIPARSKPQDWNIDHLLEIMRRLFDLDLPREALEGARMERDEVREMLWSEIRGRFEKKQREIGTEQFHHLSRQVMLMIVDSKWKEHLYAMDALREGIGWRGVGGDDPLVAYKREAFFLFSDLVSNLREELVSFLFHVQPVSEQPRRRAAVSRSAPAGRKRKAAVAAGKIGRNDPCPCGSGKKYKKCCGR